MKEEKGIFLLKSIKFCYAIRMGYPMSKFILGLQKFNIITILTNLSHMI